MSPLALSSINPAGIAQLPLPKRKCLHLPVIWIFLVLMPLMGGQVRQPRKGHPHLVMDLLWMTLNWAA